MSRKHPPQPKKATRISLIALNQALELMQDTGMVPRRPFQAPALPPGVLPRGAHNALAQDNAMVNYGYLNAPGTGMCGLGFPGYTYLAELSQKSEYRAPCEVLAKEMTRKWVKFNGASEDKLKDLQTAFDDFGIREHFAMCALNDGLFGRSQLFIRIKGQESDQRRKLPLIVDADGATISKGALLGFKPIEPIWTTPYSYNSVDPTRDDFYRPDWWYVLGKQTHATRLLTFVSRPLPDILKPAYNFSGMSLSQLVEPYVIRWLKTVDSVNRLISNYSTSGVMTNMESTLEGGEGTDLFKRMALFNQLRDNRGLMLLDKDTEEFFQYNVPLSSLDKLQAQAQEHMAAPTHIPLVKLTGVTPSGLNASSEEDLKVFYDWVASDQIDTLDPHLRTVLKVVQLHLWGKVDPKITAEWVPLDSPTDEELSGMRKSDGDRDIGYVAGGIVSADEVRERLRNDPNSGYSFIKGDAPTPPLEQEHELGEKSKDADHERGEESAQTAAERAEEAAQAQHKRDKELAATKKPAAK
jgi:phage-related protein (TIGR01555 family)